MEVRDFSSLNIQFRKPLFYYNEEKKVYWAHCSKYFGVEFKRQLATDCLTYYLISKTFLVINIERKCLTDE